MVNGKWDCKHISHVSRTKDDSYFFVKISGNLDSVLFQDSFMLRYSFILTNTDRKGAQINFCFNQNLNSSLDPLYYTPNMILILNTVCWGPEGRWLIPFIRHKRHFDFRQTFVFPVVSESREKRNILAYFSFVACQKSGSCPFQLKMFVRWYTFETFSLHRCAPDRFIFIYKCQHIVWMFPRLLFAF